MTDKNLILAEEKEGLAATGHTIKSLLPGANRLTDNQATSLGNYALISKANPFRGEVYGFPDRQGNLVLVDGYKLLVRWAKKISDYDEDYGERLPPGIEGLKNNDIGYRCTIMRDDRRKGIKEYISLGATFKEAYDIVGNSAIGIVMANETRNSPPKGWSWDQVARKRALKNVLNQAYAMPSIEELARLNWEVDGQETLPEDWAAPEVYQTVEEAEAHAKLAAQERKRQETVAEMSPEETEVLAEEIKSANDAMNRNGDDDPIEGEAELPPSMEASTAFWGYINAQGIARVIAGQFIQEAHGDFDKALKALKKAQEN